jgi:hypothetical protein
VSSQHAPVSRLHRDIDWLNRYALSCRPSSLRPAAFSKRRSLTTSCKGSLFSLSSLDLQFSRAAVKRRQSRLTSCLGQASPHGEADTPLPSASWRCAGDKFQHVLRSRQPAEKAEFSDPCASHVVPVTVCRDDPHAHDPSRSYWGRVAAQATMLLTDTILTYSANYSVTSSRPTLCWLSKIWCPMLLIRYRSIP